MANNGEEQLTRAMEGLGFVRRRVVLTMPLEGAFYAWLGTNGASRGLPKGWFDALPIVGIGHHGLNARLGELYPGASAKSYRDSVMLRKPLYSMVPEMGPFDWRLTGGEHPDHDAEILGRIVDAMETHGLPWVRSLLVGDAVVEGLSQYYDKDSRRAVDWVLYLEVTGRRDEAMVAREKVLAVYDGGEPLSYQEACLALRRMDEIPYEPAKITRR